MSLLTHTHTHTHTHACTHTQTCTHIYAFNRRFYPKRLPRERHTNTHTQTCTQTYVHAYNTHSLLHTPSTHIYKFTHTHAYCQKQHKNNHAIDSGSSQSGHHFELAE